MNVVSLIGYIVELGGLWHAARGVRSTWKDNAPGKSIWPKLTESRRWIATKVLRRRPRPVKATMNATLPSATSTLSGTAINSKPLTVQMTTDERLAALAGDIGHVRELATDAHRRITEAGWQRSQDLEALRSELQHQHSTLAERDSDMAARGVPRAATGLVWAAIGLLIQGVGSAMPPW